MAYRQDGYGSLMAKSRAQYTNPLQRFQISRNFFGQQIGFSPNEMEFTYNDDALARRICDLPAHDATRVGWTLKTRDDCWCEDSQHDLESVLEDLKVDDKIAEAIALADATGGAVIHIMADDMAMEEEPINLSSISSIRRLEVYDRTRIFFNTSYLCADVKNPNFGKLEFANITNVYGVQFLCHTSRLIFLTGLPVTKRARGQMGEFIWGGSKIDLCMDEIANLRSAWAYALMDLGKQSQSVLSLGGLANKLMLGDAGEQMVLKRLNMIDAGRSQMNTLTLDKDTDSFEQFNMTLAGVKDIITEHANAFSAVAGIPAPILFGRNMGGSTLSQAGKENSVELEAYYNDVCKKQKSEVKPCLLHLLPIIAACSSYGITLPDKYHIKFKPLFQKTEDEEADIEVKKATALKTVADAVKTLNSVGALDTAEIRQYLKDEELFPIEDVEQTDLNAPVPPDYAPFTPPGA